VAWQIAGADGHPVRGRFTFVVLQSARVDTAPSGPADEPAVDTTPPAGAAGPATHHPGTTFPDDGRLGVESPAYVAIRWVGFSALLVIIGVVGLEYLVTRAVRRRGRAGSGAIVQGVRGRSAVIGAAAAGVLIATAGARAVAQFAVIRDPGGAEGLELLSRILLRTTWGWGWLLQVAAAIAALATFLRMRRSPDRGWPLALTAALVLAVTPALAGHAAAVEGYGPLPILTDALHVLGAGGWLGTLFALLLAGLPAAVRLGNRDASAVVAELVNAFSPAALLFAGVAATTGVFAAWLHLGTLAAVWQSTYGRTLLLKVVVLSGAAATGFYNWRRVRPALGDEVATARLRRSSTVELLIALAVLLVTAVLVATPPPGEAG
jgi:putative copper export protein